MATLEEHALARDSIHNLEGLRRDIRRNAVGYKADIASARLTLAQSARIMDEDAKEFLRRIGWQDRIDTPGPLRVKLGNGLTALGASLVEVRAAVNELRGAAQALRDAAKTTVAEIDAASDALLAAVVAHETVW